MIESLTECGCWGGCERRGGDGRDERIGGRFRYERGSGHVVGEPFEDLDVLANRSGQDDQIGVRHHDQIVATDVYGVKPHRGLQDVLPVHSDHEAARPAVTRRHRERPADEAASDDADTRKKGRVVWRLLPA